MRDVGRLSSLLDRNRELQAAYAARAAAIEKELKHVRWLAAALTNAEAAAEANLNNVAAERQRAGKRLREVAAERPRHDIDDDEEDEQDQDETAQEEQEEEEGAENGDDSAKLEKNEGSGAVDVYCNGYEWRQLRPRAAYVASVKATRRRHVRLAGGSSGASSSFEDPFSAGFIAFGPTSSTGDEKPVISPIGVPARSNAGNKWHRYGSPLSIDCLAIFTSQLSFPSPYNSRNMTWMPRDDTILCSAVAKAAEKQQQSGEGGEGGMGSLLLELALSDDEWLRAAILIRHCRAWKVSPPESVMAKKLSSAAANHSTLSGASSIVRPCDMLRFTDNQLGSITARCCEVRWHCVLLPLLLSGGKSLIKGLVPRAVNKIFSSEDEEWDASSDQFMLQSLKQAKWRIDRSLWISLAKLLSQRDHRLRTPFSVVSRFQRKLTVVHVPRCADSLGRKRAWNTEEIVNSIADSFPDMSLALRSTFSASRWTKEEIDLLMWIANNRGGDFDSVFCDYTRCILEACEEEKKDSQTNIGAEIDSKRGVLGDGEGVAPFYSSRYRFFSKSQIWWKLRRSRGIQLATGSEAFKELLKTEEDAAKLRLESNRRSTAAAVMHRSRSTGTLFGIPTLPPLADSVNTRCSSQQHDDDEEMLPGDESKEEVGQGALPASKDAQTSRRSLSQHLSLFDFMYVVLWSRAQVLPARSRYQEIATLYLSRHRPELAISDVLRDLLKTIDRSPPTLLAVLFGETKKHVKETAATREEDTCERTS